MSAVFFYQQPGSGAGTADYIIGNDVITPGGIRSMRGSAVFGRSRTTTAIRYTGAEDNGGVHINSGIASHAFFLAVEGGTNRTSGSEVQGVGAANREQMEKVFYRAFTQLLPVQRPVHHRARGDPAGGAGPVPRQQRASPPR